MSRKTIRTMHEMLKLLYLTGRLGYTQIQRLESTPGWRWGKIYRLSDPDLCVLGYICSYDDYGKVAGLYAWAVDSGKAHRANFLDEVEIFHAEDADDLLDVAHDGEFNKEVIDRAIDQLSRYAELLGYQRVQVRDYTCGCEFKVVSSGTLAP